MRKLDAHNGSQERCTPNLGPRSTTRVLVCMFCASPRVILARRARDLGDLAARVVWQYRRSTVSAYYSDHVRVTFLELSPRHQIGLSAWGHRAGV